MALFILTIKFLLKKLSPVVESGIFLFHLQNTTELDTNHNKKVNNLKEK